LSEQVDALAKEIESLKRDADELYSRIQRIDAKRSELASKAEEELATVIGGDLPNFGLGEKFQEDKFKGAPDVNKIMSDAGNNLREIKDKMATLEITPFLRFGTIGKLKNFFTRSPLIAEMLQIDSEAESLWERWHSVNDQIKEKVQLRNEIRREFQRKAAA
jgi:uncharacterized coiled-coil DUF342 family protein